MMKKLRKFIYWMLDSLNGGKVKSHYRDVKFILENFHSKESSELRSKSLNNLLEHAVATTPFYYEYKGFENLSDFSVIHKNIVRENESNFFSSTFKNQIKYPAYTSGSTGTPFRVYHDKNKKNRNSADVIYFINQTGYEIGNKLYYIRHWDQYNKKSVIDAWKSNIYMHPISKFSDKDFELLLHDLKKEYSSKSMICYASFLDSLSNYLEKNNMDAWGSINIQSIISISERLNRRTKKVIETYFKTNVVGRYSNVENGIIAQQKPKQGDDYYINWASYYIEILDMEQNVPVDYGTIGRIVVTDLYNYCMPMIRYDTGDIGIIGYDTENHNTPVLKKIDGRRMDMIYDTKGKHLTAYSLYHILKYPGINQFQFIQRSEKVYVFKLNVSPSFDSEADIKAEFLTLLGLDANISIEYVNEIPLLASGKRKMVMNKLFKI